MTTELEVRAEQNRAALLAASYAIQSELPDDILASSHVYYTCQDYEATYIERVAGKLLFTTECYNCSDELYRVESVDAVPVLADWATRPVATNYGRGRRSPEWEKECFWRQALRSL